MYTLIVIVIKEPDGTVENPEILIVFKSGRIYWRVYWGMWWGVNVYCVY